MSRVLLIPVAIVTALAFNAFSEWLFSPLERLLPEGRTPPRSVSTMKIGGLTIRTESNQRNSKRISVN